MKSQKVRQLLTFAVFTAVTGVLFVLSLLLTPPQVLKSERRKPAQLPALTPNTLLSGEFMNRFEGFAADRFPFRELFRAIRGATVLDLTLQSDKSGLYRDAAVGLGQLARVDEAAYAQTAEKLAKMAERLAGLNVYYSIIPDKSAYSVKYLPGYDHAAAEAALSSPLENLTYIPIINALEADCYYKTDLHWNQTRIRRAAHKLLTGMGAGATIKHPEASAGTFLGVYAGQLALPAEAEPLTYTEIPGLTASYLNDSTLAFEGGQIYYPQQIDGIDPYNVFLNGPQPLVIIENEIAWHERELYLFRDSFGSSLAPLLAPAYSRITVIDLRYIHADALTKFVQFTPGADALFIYGAQSFNQPGVLQII